MARETGCSLLVTLNGCLASKPVDGQRKLRVSVGSRLELNRLRMCVSDGLQKLSLWGPFKQTPPQGRPASSEYSPLLFSTLSPRASWEKDEARLKGKGQKPQVENGTG